MRIDLDPVPSDAQLPSRVDVVVIGGGILGVSTAYFLARRGVSVAVCEKGEIGAEQSGRNWGWVRKQGGDPSEIPLTLHSVELWEGMNQDIGAETGFRTCGSVSLASSAKDIAACEGWVDSVREYLPDLGTRVLSTRELQTILPGAPRHFLGGLYTATDGRAEPQLAAPALAKAARSRGAAIMTHCAVRGFETSAGRISGVVTEKGSIACDSVVLAGGAWCRIFCANMGIFLPQLKLRTSVMRTGPLEGGPASAAMAPGYSFRRRLDGGYTIGTGFMNYADLVPDSIRMLSLFWPTIRHEWSTIRLRLGRRFLDELTAPSRWRLDRVSPFEATRVLDPDPVAGDLDRVLETLSADFPVFRSARIAGQWAGMIDVSPDAMPFLTDVPSTPGFFIATGFSGHGFGNGPGAGHLMADLVTGAKPRVDPRPFRFSRFTDGPRPEYRARV
ncbi:D-amino acid oxidase [Hoeflea sp. BAL378]|uniref:NAD(P)/FAD-dependent oxidoreductase n=1 Tax=Hoeflea sp. BAL378 TaxID=1547437 RepID=UPI000513300E|nr:FAD-binding oxidoreductase [Hoeflea sp. BAL378]KGF69423.1 D-amino acid oxidase [Hoeflea sp. BAL378]